MNIFFGTKYESQGTKGIEINCSNCKKNICSKFGASDSIGKMIIFVKVFVELERNMKLVPVISCVLGTLFLGRYRPSKNGIRSNRWPQNTRKVKNQDLHPEAPFKVLALFPLSLARLAKPFSTQA